MLNKVTGAALAAALGVLAPAALAQTSQISATGIGCGADYSNNNLSWTCNAGEIAISEVIDIEFVGDPDGCVLGQSLVIETATVVYDINTNERYDLTLWLGDQEGTDPRGLAGAGESCSAFSVPGPFNPTPDAAQPWGDADGDQCGDLAFTYDPTEDPAGLGDTRTFTNIPITCQDNNNDGFADLQVLLTWEQQDSTACNVGTFPTGAGARSKCDYGITTNNTLPIVEGPSLELAKTVINDNGGNDVASSFDLTLTGNDGTHNAGVDYSDGDTPTIVAGVQYTVSETPNTGYTNTSITCIDTEPTPDVNIGNPFTAENGQVIVCTVVNNDIAPALTLVKAVINDDGGGAAEDDFTLRVTGAGGLCGQDGTDAYVDPDGNGVAVTPVESNCAYTVTEDPVPGYTNLGVACVDDDTAGNVPHPVTLSEGQSVTCTVTNDDIEQTEGGSITLVKQVNGGDAVAGDFTLRLSGDDGDGGDCGYELAPFSSGDVITDPQDGCLYTVSEDPLAGYVPGEPPVVCLGDAGDIGHPFTFESGDDVACTVVNNAVVTQLALVKEVVNDDEGTAVAEDWTLSADNGPSSPISGDGGFPSTAVEPGTYVLNETGPDFYTAGEWTCVEVTGAPFPVANGNEVTLEAGDDVTCTIVNDDSPTVARFLVTKEFTDGNPAEVEVFITCDTGLPLEQDFVISDGEPVNFVVTLFERGAMNCDIHESPVPAGYAPSYFADVEDGTAGTIFADDEGCHFREVEGGQFVCEIVNSVQPQQVEVTKEWITQAEDHGLPFTASANYTCYNVRAEDGSLGSFGGGFWFEGEVDSDVIEDVYPDYGGSTYCTVNEVYVDSAVEADDSECDSVPVTLGSGASCTIYNTVFFEGIPTLNQYGLAVLALLMLGVGAIGFRRFV
jgi:hypothetical protein